VSCVDGEATGTVYRDSDGDASIPYGVRVFLAVEDLELTCGCTLIDDEEEQVTEKLCDGYADDLADMAEDDARREADY